MVVCTFWLGTIWLVSKFHINPWRLLKQVGVVGRARPASAQAG